MHDCSVQLSVSLIPTRKFFTHASSLPDMPHPCNLEIKRLCGTESNASCTVSGSDNAQGNHKSVSKSLQDSV